MHYLLPLPPYNSAQTLKVNPATTLLPALLKQQGYETHAIGKWDVGYIKKHCLPTYRGYDTFLGYYTACTSDYWYHGAPGGNRTFSKCGGVDFHDSKGDEIEGALMKGEGSLNNTYDQVVFTQRAVDLIDAHGPTSNTASPFFLQVCVPNTQPKRSNNPLADLHPALSRP
jgi:arylsulfatase A-like enzyme